MALEPVAKVVDGISWPKLLFWSLWLLLAPYSCWAAGLMVMPVGAGNNFHPLPLADGRVLFVTDRNDNLDLAIWQPQQPVLLWEHHPADDDQPQLAADGLTVLFRSNRGAESGWWQRSLLKGGATPVPAPLKHKTASTFVVRYPFDSNGDGVINRRDASWIVNRHSGYPITPLALSAADPVVDRHGRLWLSVVQHGLRQLARIDHPDSPLVPDSALASWAQWRLWQQVRQQSSPHDPDTVDALWDAGYYAAANSALRASSPNNLHARWQQLRAAGGAVSQIIHTANVLIKQANKLPSRKVADRIRFDLALWLRQQGDGAQALALLIKVRYPDWQLQAKLIRVDLLTEMGQPQAALQLLATADKNIVSLALPDLFQQADRLLVALEAAGITGTKLASLLLQTRQPQLRLHWQALLARRWMAAGAYDAALRLLGGDHLPPTLARLRITILTRHAGSQLQHHPKVALRLARQVLQADPLTMDAGRIFFAAAHRMGQQSAASAWWLKQVAAQHPLPATGVYLDALRRTHLGQQLSAATKILKQLMVNQPQMWQVKMTLGWLLHRHHRTTTQRQALELYQQALRQAEAQHAAKWALAQMRHNLAGLAFALHLYGQQLALMDRWWQLDPATAAMGSILKLQAARACYQLARYREGLLWLNRLPAAIDARQWAISLRLRALMAAASNNDSQAERTLSLLLADPDIDAGMRQRLLLNRALVAIHQQQFDRASLDIAAAKRLPSDRFDRSALLRLDGLTVPFDARLVSASLQADVASANGAWIAQATALQDKLNKLPTSTARLIALYNLALAWIRQGRWPQAVARLDEAMAAIHDPHAPKFKIALQQKIKGLHVRLRSALGLNIDATELNALLTTAKPAQKITWRMIALQQPMVIASDRPSPTSARHDRDAIAQRISHWKRLQKDALFVSKDLAARVTVAYGRWLQQQGLQQAATAVLARVRDKNIDDPWLRWWLEGMQPQPPSANARARQLQRLIRQTTLAEPFHFQLIDQFYRHLAQQLLLQDEPEQALAMLFTRERRWSQLRQRSVIRRPTPRATTITKLRRGLRGDEAMALVWRQPSGTDLWWMDHQQQLYRHLPTTAMREIATALGDWQGGKTRLYWTAVHSTAKLAQALRQQLHGIDLVASPTLTHAVRIGRMAVKQRTVASPTGSRSEWQDALWQQADASVMDWRWSMQQGLHDYKRAAWRSALDAFARALPKVADRYRTRLLPLIARAALRSHEYGRGLQLIPQERATSPVLRTLRLTLAARQAEQQGDLVAAAEQWQRLLNDGDLKNWRAAVTAANGLAAIAMRGMADLQQTLHLLQQTERNIPARAKLEKIALTMNSIRLQSQFHFGSWSQLEPQLHQLSQWVIASKNIDLRWQMRLLQISSAWSFGRNRGLRQQLTQLQQEMAVDHPLQFDVANQQALMLQQLGLYGLARTAFARARAQLVHQPVAMVRERMAALHNNLGRLEHARGNLERALRHFRIAMDADRQRGDRIGLLFDRKNLAVLLLEDGQQNSKQLATAEQLLSKAQHQAQALRLPSVEAEVVASLLVNDLDKSSGSDATHQQRWMMRLQQLTKANHLSQFVWMIDWLRGRLALAAGERELAKRLLLQAMVAVDKGAHQQQLVGSNVAATLLHPQRVANDLIAMLVDGDPQQALRIALQARGETVTTIKAKKEWKRPPLLLYFVGDHKSWCWIVDQRGVQVVTLAIGRQEVKNKIKHLNQSIARHLPLKAQAQKLAAKLWLPVAAKLVQQGAEITAVDVVASSPINQLAFAVLRDQQGWLLDHYRFRYRHQARLNLPHGNDSWSRSALAHRPWQYFVGDDAQGASLPLADQEVAALTALSQGAFTAIDGGRKALLLTGRNGVLHIAGHSALLVGDANASALLLRAGERLDREQISSKKWHNDLVVLSSCGYDWRKQQIIPKGNDIVDALLNHGVKRVVAGLWQVNDLTAALTMKFFYRKLYTNMAPAQALRAAQLRIRRRFPNPEDWAALRLVLH